ncbi:hypothetical protein [Enterococcus faecalis]|uniref:hypothetical protein n=1 Tax=Enterococcus faecalis TaxID=1351 RepID=UPI00045B3F47|nr:hypothetical protein [Enterococcus faecalis]KAJ85611.1 hypothetical protein P791_1210 [Enterococcus faecalis NY9]
MTEERLLKIIQQKELEERQKKYEGKRKYRECLLKCVEKSSSNLKRRLIFIEEYFPKKTSLFLVFLWIFLFGLIGYLVTTSSLLHSLCGLAVTLSAGGCAIVICVIFNDLPCWGFTDKGIYEEIQWVNKEIESFELNEEFSLEERV